MAETNLQMRLTDADLATFAVLEDWYPSLGRTAIVRLALNELARYAIGAKKRKQEADILAEHMPQATRAAPKWTREMDEIKRERMAAGLPTLGRDELFAAGAARRLERRGR